MPNMEFLQVRKFFYWIKFVTYTKLCKLRFPNCYNVNVIYMFIIAQIWSSKISWITAHFKFFLHLSVVPSYVTHPLSYVMDRWTPPKNYNSFLLEFRNCLCNKNFLPRFPVAYKTHCIYASCYDQTSTHSKCYWIDISTVNSFYCWVFFLVPCQKVWEYWSQIILSQTQSYWKKCWNYY